jgi:hypothetical protein
MPVDTERTVVAAYRRGIESVQEARNLAFARPVAQSSDLEAFTALAGREQPDFAGVDTEYPGEVEMHRSDIEGN